MTGNLPTQQSFSCFALRNFGLIGGEPSLPSDAPLRRDPTIRRCSTLWRSVGFQGYERLVFDSFRSRRRSVATLQRGTGPRWLHSRKAQPSRVSLPRPATSAIAISPLIHTVRAAMRCSSPGPQMKTADDHTSRFGRATSSAKPFPKSEWLEFDFDISPYYSAVLCIRVQLEVAR